MVYRNLDTGAHDFLGSDTNNSLSFFAFAQTVLIISHDCEQQRYLHHAHSLLNFVARACCRPGSCVMYDMDTDAFVEGQIEGAGHSARFVQL